MDWLFQINPPSSRSSSASLPAPTSPQKSPSDTYTTQTIRVKRSGDHYALTGGKGLVVPPATQVSKALRSLSEALVWSDAVKRTDLFEYFFESRTHELILDLPLKPRDSDDTQNADIISIALLRFFNVIFENVEQQSVLFFLFSNNYINDVILLQYNLLNEEVLSYYVTLLKNLSVKLNSKTIFLLFNEHLDDFPLFSEAVKCYRHDERMIRIAARTITLNVLKVNNIQATEFLIKKRGFFAAVAQLLSEEVDVLIGILASEGGEFYKATAQLDEIIDHLLYIQDIFALGFPQLSRLLAETITRSFITPVLIDGLLRPPMNRHVSLFLITQLVQSISYAPLINLIVEKVFAVTLDEVATDVDIPARQTGVSSLNTPLGSRMGGAVRAGSGGLFDDDVLSSTPTPNSPTGRATIRKVADTVPKTTNVVRSTILGLISPLQSLGRSPLDQDLDITLTLSLLISVLRCKSVLPETLQKANLFPRRSKKSRLLMDSLITSPSGTDVSSSAVEALTYDEELVINLIRVLGSPMVSAWRALTPELAARCLIEIAATGGTRSEGLVGEQMDELKNSYRLWCGVLLDFLTQKSDLVPDLLDYESVQQPLDLDRLIKDTKLFIPSEPPPNDSTNPPTSPFPTNDGKAIDLAIRMFLLTSECLKAFGVRWDDPLPIQPVRQVGPVGQLINLNTRSMTPCVIQLDPKSAPVNGYFVFDDERILL
ncbi:hypothetical protein HDU67_008975, partial [Dinochytrium kinnereticum]